MHHCDKQIVEMTKMETTFFDHCQGKMERNGGVLFEGICSWCGKKDTNDRAAQSPNIEEGIGCIPNWKERPNEEAWH